MQYLDFSYGSRHVVSCVTCKKVHLIAILFRGLRFTPKWPLNPILTSSLTGAIVLDIRQENIGWFSGT